MTVRGRVKGPKQVRGPRRARIVGVGRRRILGNGAVPGDDVVAGFEQGLGGRVEIGEGVEEPDGRRVFVAEAMPVEERVDVEIVDAGGQGLVLEEVVQLLHDVVDDAPIGERDVVAREGGAGGVAAVVGVEGEGVVDEFDFAGGEVGGRGQIAGEEVGEVGSEGRGQVDEGAFGRLVDGAAPAHEREVDAVLDQVVVLNRFGAHVNSHEIGRPDPWGGRQGPACE